MEREEIVRAYKRQDTATLIAALKESDDAGSRRMAMRYLEKLRAAEAVPALQACLGDVDHRVRRSAIRVLGSIGGEQAIEALIFAARAGTLRDRDSAAQQLGKLRAQEAVPTLLECLDREDDRSVWSLPVAALQALGRIGDERAIPRVAELAEHAPTLSIQLRATDVLAKLGDERAIPLFVSVLTETERHLAGERWRTWIPEDVPFQWWVGRRRTVKRWIQKWAAKRLVELRAADAGPAIAAAAGSASSLRERLLLRRTARRLRQSKA